MSLSIKHYEITLEINDIVNRSPIIVHQGDSNTRYVDCTITDSGKVLTLDPAWTAIVKASNRGVTKAINNCEIINDTVIVALSDAMLDTSGELTCEVTIQDSDKIVTTQRFTVIVVGTAAKTDDIASEPEYTILTELLNKVAKVEENAEQVEKLVENINALGDINELIKKSNYSYDYAQRTVGFGGSVTFTENKVMKMYTTSTTISSGSFATGQTDITTAYISGNVTNIYNGAFSGCTSLNTIYIDNIPAGINIEDGAVPTAAEIVYNTYDKFININYLLSVAVKNIWDCLIQKQEELKELIPTKVSQLANDKGYFNNIDVRGADFASPVFLKMQKEEEKLVFYAAKAFSETPSDSATYTSNRINELLKSKQEETNALISAIPKFSIVVAEALPTEDISSTAVYLISSGDEEPNLYTEYIYVNDKWEKLGEQSVDLTGYVKNTDYAGQYEAGVIKADGRYALWVDPDGFLRCTYTSVESYAERDPGSFLSKGMLENLKEKSISETSTDVQIPTAKAVYDLFSTEKSYVDNSLNEKQNKLKAGTGVEILADGTINCTFEDYSEVRF